MRAIVYAMTNTAQDTNVIDTYLDALNEDDDAARAALVARAFTEDATFADPLLEAAGHDEIAGLAPVVQAQFPAARFRRTTEVDAHHEYIRFGWELRAEDGSVIVAGVDAGVIAADGRLRRIVGFFGELTPTS
jgi:hypothetical protein